MCSSMNWNFTNLTIKEKMTLKKNHQSQNLRYAGVLPYSFKKTDNGDYQLFVLLGKDHDGWSDFGGGPKHGESLKQTAAREAHEESLMLLGPIDEIYKSLNVQNSIKSPRSIHYLIEIPYDDDLPMWYNTLYTRLQQGSRRNWQTFSVYLEKSAIQWIPLDTFVFQLQRYPKKFRTHFVQDMLSNSS